MYKKDKDKNKDKYLTIEKIKESNLIDKYCLNGELEIIKFLVSIGHMYSDRTMEIAIKYGHLDIIKYLNNNGVRCNEYCIFLAMKLENQEIINYILKSNL